MDLLAQVAFNTILAGSVYALVASSFLLAYSATKFFNLATAVVITAGGYGAWYFTGYAPMWTAIILGIGVACLLSLGMEYAIFRPLRKKRASGLALLVASLGAMTAGQALIALVFSSQFQVFESIRIGEVRFSWFGVVATRTHAATIVAAIAIMLGMVWILRNTGFGSSVRAIADDADVAAIVGIPVEKIIAQVVGLSAAIAAVAGIAIGADTALEPLMGLPILLSGIIAAIVGGLSRFENAIAGAFLVAAIENAAVIIMPSAWKPAVSFILLLLFLRFRPQGIFAK